MIEEKEREDRTKHNKNTPQDILEIAKSLAQKLWNKPLGEPGEAKPRKRKRASSNSSLTESPYDPDVKMERDDSVSSVSVKE